MTPEDPRCQCGHRQSEHPETYGITLCRGHVLALDAEDPKEQPREVDCRCDGFVCSHNQQHPTGEPDVIRDGCEQLDGSRDTLPHIPSTQQERVEPQP